MPDAAMIELMQIRDAQKKKEAAEMDALAQMTQDNHDRRVELAHQDISMNIGGENDPGKAKEKA